MEDPYVITIRYLGDFSKLPNISWLNVVNYLINTVGECAKESIKAFKSIDGFEFLEREMCKNASFTSLHPNSRAS